MYKLNGEAFFECCRLLNELGGLLIHIDEVFDADAPATAQAAGKDVKEFLENVLKEVVWLREGLRVLGARLTDKRASELEELLRSGACTRRNVHDACLDIGKRLKDEMSMAALYVVDNKYSSYVDENYRHFGDMVASDFPSACYEITEAAKCLGFERSTACVFHLMRVLEIGIKAVNKCLGIADPVKDWERNWGSMLKKLKEEMERRDKMSPQHWLNVADKKFFAEIYASLDAVRNVWRNATMHVENKYTVDEAEHIFFAVRGFMTKLISRCDEQGQPSA